MSKDINEVSRLKTVAHANISNALKDVAEALTNDSDINIAESIKIKSAVMYFYKNLRKTDAIILVDNVMMRIANITSANTTNYRNEIMKQANTLLDATINCEL